MKEYGRKKKTQTVWHILLPVLWLLSAWLGKTIWIPAAKEVWNQCAKLLMQTHGRWFPTWNVHGTVLSRVCFGIWIASAVLWMLFWMIRLRNRFFAIVVCVCAAAAQILYGNQISAFFVVLWFCITTWICGKADDGKLKMFPRILPLLLIGCILVIALPDTLGGDSWKSMQHRAVQKIEKIWYHSGADTLPSGDFTGISDRKDSDAAALEVTMEHPASVYLRGFVGSEFSGNTWKMTETSKRAKAADLFYWLHQNGFSGNGQLACGFQAFGISAEENRVQVKNVGASRRYEYLPYEYCEEKRTLKNGEVLGEEGILAGGLRGASNYQFDMAEGSRTGYQKILNQLMADTQTAKGDSYRRSEQFYNSYVYTVNKKLSEEQRQLIAGCLEGADSDRASKTDAKTDAHTVTSAQGKQTETSIGSGDITAVKEKILTVLAEQMTYTEEISRTGAKQDQKDLLKSFLETHRGYDVHYATAAALMFRYYNIPARYVEGYLITPADVRGKKAGATLEIPQSDAHAWVEYYQDGAGWIPFEVSPPYIGVMEEAKLTTSTGSDSVKKQEEQKKKITQDNYEKSAENGKIKLPIRKIRDLAKILVLLLIIVLVILYFVRRWKIQRKRKLQFQEAGCNRRISMTFTQMLEIWFTYLQTYENHSLDTYEEEMRKYENGEKNKNQRYPEMLELYRKARFGAEDCTEAEEEKMLQYTENVRRAMYADCTLRQKCNWKFWRFFG